MRNLDARLGCSAAMSLALLALAGVGCGDEVCTLLACSPAFEIAVGHAGGWPAGTYTLEVTADGEAGSCEVAFPPACGGFQPACTGTRAWRLDLIGCSGPATAQALLIGFWSWEMDVDPPASVAVRVSSGGQELGAETYTPAYEIYWPNGPDCAPECHRTDMVTLTLP